MNNKKIYWKGIEEFTKDSEFVKYSSREFSEYLPINESFSTSRRDFLKMMGFSIAAVSLSACETPVKKAIPYLNKPIDIDPGIPNYYASTYMSGGNYCGIIVKTREGRPIKIEGNKFCPITQGGVSLEVEASVLSLYDNERLKNPNIKGFSSTWKDLDNNIISKLSKISSEKKSKIRIISNTILSPSTKSAINIFIKKYPNTKHVVYDQQSFYGILNANKFSFNAPLIPSYDFSKANIIVSFGADFLGTWLSPVEFSKQYSINRKLSFGKKDMSKHYQFESNFSLTGANADYRFPLKSSKEANVVLTLYSIIESKVKKTPLNITKISNFNEVLKVADDLWKNQGKSLVVSSSNNPDIQVLINAINHFLSNYGKTIFLDIPVNYKQGNDYLMNSFVNELENSEVSAVIFFESNPVYDYPDGFKISNLLSNVDLKISISDRFNETSSLSDYISPNHHYLESWNDCNPKLNIYTLSQPVITPLFNTRNAAENFLIWSNYSNKNYYNFIRDQWKLNLFSKQSKIVNFQKFWDTCLFNGVYNMPSNKSKNNFNFIANVSNISKNIILNFNKSINSNDSIEVCLYEKTSIGTGVQSNNPWLQESPDPISKACWDNYLTISQNLAYKYGIKMDEGKTRIVRLNIGNKSLKVPVLVQPGQADNTVGISIGYGREKSGRVSNGVGVNAYPLKVKVNGIYWSNLISDNVSIEPLNETYRIAQTQTHETYMGRKSVIQESVLSEYRKNPLSGRYFPKIFTSKGYKKPEDISLWKGHSYSNHHWGMVIDLNSCTGCGVCTIACQVENNIPVVGKDEVLNRREMHWIRVDRYYSSDADLNNKSGLEIPSNNPEVVFQPMMCQHCNNAPCETVCPVLATTHSSEGLNQMTYNRCIGTRYCANNCPYKVRRFNWFKYHDNKQFDDNIAMNTSLGKMVLNPDVTVRSRGVMEKCSMCVQRIQAGKLKAKLEKRKLRDMDITTACSSSCPADAIVFGDMNNSESSIFKLLSSEVEGRAYHVLEELSVKPNVTYLTKIRNKEKI